MTKDELIKVAQGMSAEDRAVIVAALRADLDELEPDDASPPSELDEATRNELLRRMEASDADPSRLLSWDQFQAHLSARLAVRS